MTKLLTSPHLTHSPCALDLSSKYSFAYLLSPFLFPIKVCGFETAVSHTFFLPGRSWVGPSHHGKTHGLDLHLPWPPRHSVCTFSSQLVTTQAAWQVGMPEPPVWTMVFSLLCIVIVPVPSDVTLDHTYTETGAGLPCRSVYSLGVGFACLSWWASVT